MRYLVNVRRCPSGRARLVSCLSQRQRKVAELAASGATVAEMSHMLGISENTVRTHLKSIYRVLHVSSRAELVSTLQG